MAQRFGGGVCYSDLYGVTSDDEQKAVTLGSRLGDLPPQCAALNRTNINTQLLTIEAAITRKKEHIYHAALLDPHTSAELSMDDIVSMCDELIEAHGDWLPRYH